MRLNIIISNRNSWNAYNVTAKRILILFDNFLSIFIQKYYGEILKKYVSVEKTSVIGECQEIQTLNECMLIYKFFYDTRR